MADKTGTSKIPHLSVEEKLKQNPLHQYRSYSYQHVLSVCNTTAAAEYIAKTATYQELIGASQTDRSFHPITHVSQKQSSASKVATPKVDTNNTSTEGYVNLINGFVDTDIMITEVKWMNQFVPPLNGKLPTTTVSTEGTMTIIEPHGARFFNIVKDAYDALKTDAVSSVFVLKTFFVGYTDDGKQEFIHIKPLFLQPYTLTANFSTSGAEYAMTFCGNANGASRLPFTATTSEPFTFSSGQNLGEALTNCANKLTQKSVDDFNSIWEINGKSEGSTPPGRWMEFRIQFDDQSQDYATYPIDNIKEANSTTSFAGAEGFLSTNFTFGKGASIESIIETIMRSSSKVEEDAADTKSVSTKTSKVNRSRQTKKVKKDQYIFKINSTVQYNTHNVIVFYTISKFKLKYTDINEALKGDIYQDDSDAIPLELDYMFTGENVDILDFNIKMNQGMSFFYTLTGTDIIPSGSQYLKVKKKSDSKDNKVIAMMGLPSSSYREYMVIPKAGWSKIKDTKDATQSAGFYATLAKFAGQYEVFSVDIQIMGNPTLLNETSITPEEIRSGHYITEYASSPYLVRINVMMPNPDTGEIETMWYKGRYYIFNCENVFAEGTFTQNIHLYGLPQDTSESQVKVNKSDQKKGEGTPSTTPPVTAEKQKSDNTG